MLFQSGCLSDTTRAPFSEDRVYEHVIYGPDQCAKLDPIFNCAPSVRFFPSGRAELTVTDIIGVGTYRIDGDEVVYASDDGDVGALRFKLSADESELTDETQGWTWKRK
jgi:hypothetical protein